MKTTRHPKYVALLAKLKAGREARGWTQAELGKALRRPQAYISKIELGDQRMDLVEFYDWARALEADPLALAGELFADLDSFRPQRRRAILIEQPKRRRRPPSCG